jgi:hypothetical protein
MSKVDVFLDHAALYIMSTPEASLFTDSLPEPFLKAKQDLSSGQGASKLVSSPFFGPVLSSKKADDLVQPPVFKAFKDLKTAEKKEKKKKDQLVLKGGRANEKQLAKKQRRIKELQKKQASQRQLGEARDALEDASPPVDDVAAQPGPPVPLSSAASSPDIGVADPSALTAPKNQNLKQMQQQKPSKNSTAQIDSAHATLPKKKKRKSDQSTSDSCAFVGKTINDAIEELNKKERLAQGATPNAKSSAKAAGVATPGMDMDAAAAAQQLFTLTPAVAANQGATPKAKSSATSSAPTPAPATPSSVPFSCICHTRCVDRCVQAPVIGKRPRGGARKEVSLSLCLSISLLCSYYASFCRSLE